MGSRRKPRREIVVAVGCLFSGSLVDHETGEQSSTTGEFLLAKRRDKHLQELDDKWELPGGRVESTEEPEQCVVREFLEETGYQVEVTSHLERAYAFIRDYPDFRQYTKVVCFVCRLASPQRVSVEPDQKIEEVRWFHPDEINYRQVLQGSREFLVDVANHLKINIQAEFERTSFLAVFRAIDPNLPGAIARIGRWYSMSIQFMTATNEYVLVTRRAGDKQPIPRVRVEEFRDFQSLVRKSKERINDRRTHGYSLTKCDLDFPLLDWMRDTGVPIDFGFDERERATQLALPLG